MLKFQRNYEVIFDIGNFDKDTDAIIPERRIIISYPITLNFNITLGVGGSANEAKLQFYNLAPDIRKALWLDNYNIGSKVIYMIVRAGYGEDMPIIFLGTLQNCVSYKDGGSTEWHTDLQAFEAGQLFQYGYINSTYVKGTAYVDILNDALKNDSQTNVGYISKDLGKLDSDKTFIGQTIDVFKREFEGYELFVSKGELNILNDKEAIPAELPLLTDSSGLLGSPKRSGFFTEIEMLFEPKLNVGQAVQLKSALLPEFNQEYKIANISHSGTISAVTSGSLTTTLTLFLFDAPPEILSHAAPLKYEAQTTTSSSGWEKPVKGRITSPFGRRSKPLPNASSNHQGIDIGAAAGTPIHAPADGVVILSKYLGGYGRTVQIDHGTINGVKVTSLYGHMRSFNVQQGQRVYKGQTVLGLVGSSGNSKGPHLHFEIRENNRAVNPVKYIGSY